MKKIKCAVIGPGNIGTDLLAKLQRSPVLEPVWMVGIDPESDGLKRARDMGIKTTVDGVDGLLPHGPVFDGKRVSVYMEVEGLGDYLPKYAGNLDIMPAAAARTAEMFAEEMLAGTLKLEALPA